MRFHNSSPEVQVSLGVVLAEGNETGAWQEAERPKREVGREGVKMGHISTEAGERWQEALLDQQCFPR